MEIVNGFACKTCTDVEYAKKNINPAHPKEGPVGPNDAPAENPRAGDPVIQFGGSIQAPQLNPTSDAGQGGQRRDGGGRLDITT